MRFSLVDNSEENIHDLFFDVPSEIHELAENAVQDRLQVVSLTGVFAVKELKETVDELVANLLHDLARLQVGGQDELEE